mgnify:FL=1|jgi:hypothetical protein
MIKKLAAALVLTFCFCSMSDTVSAQWPWGYSYRQRVVGYQPHVVWLPQGTTLNINGAYVDPYRRTVTVGVNAQFYHIPRVNTFNFYNGYQPPINHHFNQRR